MVLKKCLLGMALLVLLVFSAQAFGQNAVITGIVTDASGGVLQGAKITATNEATNIKQEVTTSNSGVYNLNLPVGNYDLTTEMTGFQTQKKSQIRLGVSSQLRVNFEMTVKELKAEVIDVNVKSENLILESGSTIGVVIPEDQIAKLPLVNSNVMDLVKVMGGVVYTDASQIFYGDQNTIAGLSANNINIQKDGVTANEVRNPTGFNTPVNLNPDLIGEFKVIMQPVDAELGRGSGQIQIVTRSGANAFRGSANWNVQNSRLNGSTWSDNKSRIKPTWKNQNEFSVNVGGPVIKNKTFFFVLFDEVRNVSKDNNINVLVPTPCARKGIFRYFDGYQNANFLFNGVDSTSAWNRASNALTRRSVNSDGTPVTGLMQPNYMTAPYNVAGISTVPSELRATSVFGPIKQIVPRLGGTGAWDPRLDPNCEQVQVGADGLPTSAWVDYLTTGSAYNALRAPDKSGYVAGYMGLIKSYLPNNYDVGDGLNYGGYRWTRRNQGIDNAFGVGETPNRHQVNIRIDHNISTRHRLSGSYTWEQDRADDAMRTLQIGFGGKVVRNPMTLSSNLTSTLRPNFLNELRFGLTHNDAFTYSPFQAPTGDQLRKTMYNLLPTGDWPGFQGVKTEIPLLVTMFNAALGTNQFHPFGAGRGNMATDWGTKDNRWSYADTITLTLGRHSLRIGGETQRTTSDYSVDGTVSFGAATASVYPLVTGGSNTSAAITGFYPSANTWTLPGTVGNSNSAGNMGYIANMLNLWSGSVSGIRQFFFINEATATRYNNIADGEIYRQTKFRQNMFNIFVQDNWRLTDDLTLNLGMRYEWYGVPYLGNGMTAGFKGGTTAAFGLTGRSFKNWMNLNYNPLTSTDVNDAYRNCTDGTGAKVICENAELAFIGPGSPNPGQKYYNNDNNNFGPVFGFAYSLPWGGKGKTVLRGGLQINYMQFARAGSAIADMPGLTADYTFNNGGNYMDLSSIKTMIPITLPDTYKTPANRGTLSQRAHNNLALTFFDPGIRTPYTESLNLILTRTIGSSLTLDVRYAGNLSHKQTASINLNSANYVSTGLLDAFTQARRGENPALLDKFFRGVNIAGATSGATPWGKIGVDINPRTGQLFNASEELRAASGTSSGGWTIQQMLAAGQFNSLASWMGTANINAAWNPGLSAAPAGEYGQILRIAGMPDNIITANPQFGSVNWTANFNDANYHSMQAQITMRPTHGLGLSATYTWSRQMGSQGFSDFGNRAADYGVTGGRFHALTSYGTFDLPFGPNRWLFSSVSPNIVGRIIGGWQLSWIHTMNTGTPGSIGTSYNYLWGGGMPNKVYPFDNKAGYVSWAPGATNGQFYGGKYSYAQDPQCFDPNVTFQGDASRGLPSLATACPLYTSNLAANPTQFVFVAPLPGVRGNFSRNQVMGPGAWTTDGAASKTIRLTEGKSLSLRVDATNVFNHAQPAAPSMTAGYGSYLGLISSKTGQRKFQAKIRIDF